MIHSINFVQQRLMESYHLISNNRLMILKYARSVCRSRNAARSLSNAARTNLRELFIFRIG